MRGCTVVTGVKADIRNEQGLQQAGHHHSKAEGEESICQEQKKRHGDMVQDVGPPIAPMTISVLFSWTQFWFIQMLKALMFLNSLSTWLK